MTTPGRITDLKPNEIFVFGSNLAGIHGAGAARDALRFGAKYGVALGPMGQTYAIATKDQKLRTLPIYMIQDQVKAFLTYASAYKDQWFLVTRIGCGLAGYTAADIGPLFTSATSNVILPSDFEPWRSSSSASSLPRESSS